MHSINVECKTPIFEFCYIPPENTYLLRMNWCEQLEEFYKKVKKKIKKNGCRTIFGDFNARTTEYDEYIRFDRLDGLTLNIFDN